MKNSKKTIKRNRKNENLAGLYVVPNEVAYRDGKLRPEVYGVVDKDTPYVAKPGDPKKGKPRRFKEDATALLKECKHRILAFWGKFGKRQKMGYFSCLSMI